MAQGTFVPNTNFIGPQIAELDMIHDPRSMIHRSTDSTHPLQIQGLPRPAGSLMDGKVQLESFLNVAQQLFCNDDVCKMDNERS